MFIDSVISYVKANHKEFIVNAGLIIVGGLVYKITHNRRDVYTFYVNMHPRNMV